NSTLIFEVELLSIQATDTAIRPPTTCMTPAPPTSTNPGTPKFVPSCTSHPPPHTQWANNGKAKPARPALARQIGASLQRSVPALSGIIAASPAANISRQRVSARLQPESDASKIGRAHV